MTRILPLSPNSTAGLTAGSIPTTGKAHILRISLIAAPVAVLQATTRHLTPTEDKNSAVVFMDKGADCPHFLVYSRKGHGAYRQNK